jgi:hypothetical protein
MDAKPGQGVLFVNMTFKAALVGFLAMLEQGGDLLVAVLEEVGHVIGGVVTTPTALGQGDDLLVTGLLDPRHGTELNLMTVIVAVDFDVDNLHVAFPSRAAVAGCDQSLGGRAIMSLKLGYQAGVDQFMEEGQLPAVRDE